MLVEGGDCAGKSTLANALAQKLKWQTAFIGHQAGVEQLTRYANAYQAHNIVYDRGHFSEEVYSNIFSREEPWDDDDSLRQIIAERGILLWARPSDSVITARWQVKEQAGVLQSTRQHQLLQVHRQFDALRKTITLPHVIDYDSQDQQALHSVVAQAVKLIDSNRP